MTQEDKIPSYWLSKHYPLRLPTGQQALHTHYKTVGENLPPGCLYYYTTKFTCGNKLLDMKSDNSSHPDTFFPLPWVRFPIKQENSQDSVKTHIFWAPRDDKITSFFSIKMSGLQRNLIYMVESVVTVDLNLTFCRTLSVDAIFCVADSWCRRVSSWFWTYSRRFVWHWPSCDLTASQITAIQALAAGKSKAGNRCHHYVL